jgi:hypothetical protein
MKWINGTRQHCTGVPWVSLFILGGRLGLRVLFACLIDNIEDQFGEDNLLHLVEKYLYLYERSKGGIINTWRCL